MTYLQAANVIFQDMQNGTSPCGGIYWSKVDDYTNAIANELYLSVAASLANRMPSNKEAYTAIAQGQWDWFKASGLINSNNLINDGLTEQCTNNGQQTWSYNQGVILGGLVEL
jgi:predicted alpha-1,6-mannanase (GH76 family)